MLSRKKLKNSQPFFEVWKIEVFHFFMRMFEKVTDMMGLNETSDETHTKYSLDNFRSNETAKLSSINILPSANF